VDTADASGGRHQRVVPSRTGDLGARIIAILAAEVGLPPTFSAPRQISPHLAGDLAWMLR
jgi:hypothetical protein